MILQNEGHEVSVARNGNECFEKLGVETPDLILMDVMMPGENGWDVCRKIKTDEKTKDIPIAMFTVRTSQDSIKKSYESGADAHIDKPFDSKELMLTIGNLIKKVPV